MPSKVASIFADIGVVLGGFNRGMQAIKSSFLTLNNVAGDSEAILRQAGFALTAVSVAAAALGRVTIKTFVEFEQSIANVASVLDGMDSDFEALESAARKAAIQTIFTANQAADAMYVLGSAGLETGEIFSALEPILALAAATQAEIADSARLVVSAMVAFQIPFSDTARAANAFAAAIANSQATMDRLTNSMKFVAPVARAAGISFEQTTAALSQLLDAGISASTAGVYLRGIMLSLQNPTMRARGAIRSLGLSMEDVSPQVNDLAQIIQNLESVQAGAVDKGDELADIFGRRYTTAMQVLIRLGSTALRDFEAGITGTNKAFDLQMVQITTVKGGWLLLKSVLQDLAIGLGKVLLPALDFVTKSLRGMFLLINEAFNALPPILQKAVVGFGALATVLIAVLGPLALFVGFLPKMALGIGILAGSIASSIAPFIAWAGAIGLAVTAIAGATAAFMAFRKGSESGIKRPVEETMSVLRAFEQRVDRTNFLLDEYAQGGEKAAHAAGELGRMFVGVEMSTTAMGKALTVNTVAIREQIQAERELIDIKRQSLATDLLTNIDQEVKKRDELIERVRISERVYEGSLRVARGMVAIGNQSAAATKKQNDRLSAATRTREADVNALEAQEKALSNTIAQFVRAELGITSGEISLEEFTAAVVAARPALAALAPELYKIFQQNQKLNKSGGGSTQRDRAERLKAETDIQKARFGAVAAANALIQDELERALAANNLALDKALADAEKRGKEVAVSLGETIGLAHEGRLAENAFKRKDAADKKARDAAEKRAIASAERIARVRNQFEQQSNAAIAVSRANMIADIDQREMAQLKARFANQIVAIKRFVDENAELSVEGKRLANLRILTLEQELIFKEDELRVKQAERREDERKAEVKRLKKERDKALSEDNQLQETMAVIDGILGDFSRDIQDIVLDGLFGGNKEVDRRTRDRLQDLDEFHRQQKARLAGNSSALMALERDVAEQRRRIQQDANEQIGSAWTKLWEGLKRSFIRNILQSMERSLREFIKRAILRLAALRLGEAAARKEGGGMLTFLKVLGTFASIASGNPLPALAAGSIDQVVGGGGGGAGPGTHRSPDSVPFAGKPALGRGEGITVVINNDGLMRGALVMADDPEIMDRVVRNTLEPAIARIQSENL